MKNNTLATHCVHEIKQMILKCKLRPGEKLKGEFLVNTLHVGLSPIREGLSRLVSTKLIESCDNVGFKVSSITKNKLTDFYHTLAKIESLMLSDAMTHGEEAWEANIVAKLYSLSKIEKSKRAPYMTWSICNDQFHEAILEGCSSVELKQIRQNLILRKEWYNNLAYGQFDNETAEVNHIEHKRLGNLVLTRKISLASSTLYSHTIHGIDALTKKLAKLGYLEKD